MESDNKKFARTLAKIKKYEEISDKMEVEIADYLTKVSEGELSEETTQEIRGMMGVINDLERVSDICYQMSKVIERKAENKIWFTPEQRENLRKMFSLVEQSVEHMHESLKSLNPVKMLPRAVELENAINNYRDVLRKEYLANISKGSYNIESGIIYNDIFSSMEKIGDHLINVSEALAPEPHGAKT
jgi:phosphate:Na+ symporter